jgi:hypothetical protein
LVCLAPSLRFNRAELMDSFPFLYFLKGTVDSFQFWYPCLLLSPLILPLNNESISASMNHRSRSFKPIFISSTMPQDLLLRHLFAFVSPVRRLYICDHRPPWRQIEMSRKWRVGRLTNEGRPILILTASLTSVLPSLLLQSCATMAACRPTSIQLQNLHRR